MPKLHGLHSSLDFTVIVDKAKQNRAFASVTYKIRRADFPARAERVEFSRKIQVCINQILREKKGKPTLKQAKLVNGRVFP